MTEIVLISLFFLQMIISYLNLKSKYFEALSVFILILIMGTTTQTADYDAYSTYYYNMKYIKLDELFDPAYLVLMGLPTDTGYNAISWAFINIGCSYQEFKFISSCIFMIIMSIYLKRFNGSMSLIIGLYIVFPFFIDIIQVRNFFLQVCVIVSLYYYTTKKQVDKKKYIIFLLIGTSFHALGLLFFPFLIFDYLIGKRKYKIICWMFIALGATVPFYSSWMLGKADFFSVLLLGSDSLSRFSLYADNQYSSYIYYYIVEMILVVLSWAGYRYAKKCGVDTLVEKKILSFSLYWLCLAPLYPIFIDIVNRGERVVLILVYVLFSRLFIHMSKEIKIAIVICLFGIAMFDGRLCLYGPGQNEAVVSIIQSNVFSK